MPGQRFWQLASFVFFFGLWELAGRWPVSPAFPPFSSTFQALIELLKDGSLLKAYLITLQPLAIGCRRLARRNSGHARDNRFDVGRVDDGQGSGFGGSAFGGWFGRFGGWFGGWFGSSRTTCAREPGHGTRLVDHVDRAVRHLVVAQVA